MALLDRPAGYEVGRRKRAGERGDRFDRSPYHDWLSVGDAALEAAGVVRAAGPFAGLAATLDDVHHGRAEASRLLEPKPELNALDDGDAHDGAREGGIEAAVPLNVAAEADRQARSHDMEHTSDGVGSCFVYSGHHRRFGRRVRAAQRTGFGFLARPRGLVRIEGHATDLGRERPHVYAELLEQGAGDRPRGDSGRGFSRRGALEDVANVGQPVLHRPGQISVARPQIRNGRGLLVPGFDESGQFGGMLRGQRLDLHDARPVLPVPVSDQQQDGRSDRQAVADAGEYLGPILFDGSAPRTTPVAQLATGKIDCDLAGGQRQPGRHALDRGRDGGPVRLTGSQETQPSHGSEAYAGRESACAPLPAASTFVGDPACGPKSTSI